jgi:HAD superfamily hydrolase (TIGR01549 family)
VALRVFNAAAFAHAPRLVVFDLDDTLYRYDLPHRAALDAAALKAQALLGLAREPFRERYDAARDAVKAQLAGTAASHSRLLYFLRVIEGAGLGAQPAIALDLEQTYWTVFLDAAVLLPDAVELLEDLRLAGIPLALVTDLTAQIQLRKLVSWGLDRFFAAIVTSEEAGREKPDAAPFALLRQKLGDMPAPVWAIGDELGRDIAGAKRHLAAATLLRCDSAARAEPVPELDLAFDGFKDIRHLLAAARRG